MDRTGEHSKKEKAKLGVVYATGRAIQRKSPCWICQEVGHRNKDCPKKKQERGRTQSRGRGRNQSNSRQRDQSKKRRNSPYSKKSKSKKSNKNNRTRADSSKESGSIDNDRSSRSRSRSGSENEEDTPPRGEKSKKISSKGRHHGNFRVVASHKTRRIGGRANPTPPLQIQIFKKASDKEPQNERLEVAIGDTGCTTSCIPL